jgi:CMP-N-acetylneuraminic acid synthetase
MNLAQGSLATPMVKSVIEKQLIGTYMEKPNILVIIPVRKGSKGLPGKNMRVMCGKPLLEWTLIELKKSKVITDICVSTDDERASYLATQYNCCVLRREKHLCSDIASLTDVLRDASKYFYEHNVVVEVLCTNPLHTYKDIEAIIKKLIDTKASSVVGVTLDQEHHPERMKWLNGDKLVDFIPEKPNQNRQDYLPKCYGRTSGILAMTRDSLMKDGRGAGKKRLAYVLPSDRCVDIDTEYDFIVANELLKRRLK